MKFINGVPIIQSHCEDFETVTPDIARCVRENFRLPYERPQDGKRLDRLERAALNGGLGINDVYFCTSLDTQARHLVEGSHRHIMAAERGISFVTNRHEVIVASEDDKRRLWWTFDGDRRDLADYIRALRAEQYGIGENDLNQFSRACGYLESAFSAEFLANAKRASLSLIERAMIAETYLIPAADYFAATRHCTSDIRKALRSGLPIALGCVLMATNKKRATSFFESIARNDGLQPGDPRHLFHRSILGNNCKKSGILEQAQRLARCWNSYYHNADRERQGKLGEGVTVPLAGTSFIIGS